MTAFPFDIVGFDLDGTFLDTSGDLTAAVNVALADAGRPPIGVDRVKSMIGGGGRHMLAQALDSTGGYEADELDRLYTVLLDYYEANIAIYTQPFPGALDALDELAAMGVKTAIVTNKVESLAVHLLTELGVLDRFATVIGGDTLGPGRAKPAADPILEMIARLGGGRAAFVGDSIYDITSAKNAGIPNIACSFGFLLQPVEELDADAIIDGFDALIPTLRTLSAT